MASNTSAAGYGVDGREQNQQDYQHNNYNHHNQFPYQQHHNQHYSGGPMQPYGMHGGGFPAQPYGFGGGMMGPTGGGGGGSGGGGYQGQQQQHHHNHMGGGGGGGGASGMPMILPPSATHRHHSQPILPAAHTHQTLADANAFLLRQHHQQQQRHYQQQKQQQEQFQKQQQQQRRQNSQYPEDRDRNNSNNNETDYRYDKQNNSPYNNNRFDTDEQYKQQQKQGGRQQKEKRSNVPIAAKENEYSNKDNNKKETQFDKIWDTMFEKLLQYKRQHGDCLVPKKSIDYPKLGNWVNNQRALWRAGRLTKERKDRLDNVGFVWCARFITEQKQWNEMFIKLTEYQKEHGDCQVPQRYAEDPKLAHWVYNQRQKEDVIPPERKKKLESIGFQWKLRQLDQWETLYEKLVEYKQKHGHCRVPTNYKEDPKLGTWVSFQRTRRDHMTDDRFERLDKIGFVWSALETWPAMFDRLVEYHKKHGHCKVPTDYKKDPKLASWVQAQRNLKDRGMLATDRREKLKAIGFAWKVRKKGGPHSSPSSSPSKADKTDDATGKEEGDHDGGGGEEDHNEEEGNHDDDGEENQHDEEEKINQTEI